MKDPKDNWLKREIEREKRISAWDLDEPNKVRRSHEQNCPKEKLAVEHAKIHEGNIYSSEDEVVINSIASHHGDTNSTSIISSIVAIADAVSASRPGARNDSSENYIQRLEQLEEIGNKMDGVEKAFAVQAGRELRVMVKPEEIDDLTAHQIAREIKEKIESELKYPGTIKVTVIRETRAQEEAK